MKKRNVLNLIKYHVEDNNYGFRQEAIEIAHDFDRAGDTELAEYVLALLSDANTFVPQTSGGVGHFLRRMDYSRSPLPLPEVISEDVKGIINAVGHDAGINKFLFQGPPGTGKTETAKHVARILERDLFVVDFSEVIDSKLGQTSKNITTLFREINGFANPGRIVVLFDEIDALAMDRNNSHDVREMGRATSTFLRELDSMNTQVVLIATTNMYGTLDKAMIRRFDSVIDFGRYTRDDLLEIATTLLNVHLAKFRFAGKDVRLFNKIMRLMDEVLYPAELSNLIKTAIAFSNPGEPFDYMRRLYKAATGNVVPDAKSLREQGFSMREIETLTGTPISTLSRELKG